LALTAQRSPDNSNTDQAPVTHRAKRKPMPWNTAVVPMPSPDESVSIGKFDMD
jgi:hypothetical protein